jgi:pimeloyl-ACP methyl ester carboxylesterase
MNKCKRNMISKRGQCRGRRVELVWSERDIRVELSVEMAKAIPQSSLWVIPNGGHGPVIGNRWLEFVRTATAFLHG